MKNQADYLLYAMIGSLSAAQAVTDWHSPQAYIGVVLAGLVALKAKRSGNGAKEG